MSVQVEAWQVQEGDVVPGVGPITQVVRTPAEVALTTFWATWVTHRLAPDHPVWVDRPAPARVVCP